LPLAAEEESTIGRTGRTQGESTVTNPERNAKNKSIAMIGLSLDFSLFYYKGGGIVYFSKICKRKEKDLLIEKAAWILAA
jgi:hypothetical protein